MGNQLLVFRTLVVASLLLPVVAGALDAAAPALIPEAVRDAHTVLTAWRPFPKDWRFFLAAGLYEIAVLAAFVGLLLLRNWARVLAVVVTAATLVQSVLLGPFVYSGVAFALSYLAKVCWGGTLAMAFWSDLRARFR